MKITGMERSTGMGAKHFVAIPIDGEWIPLSKVKGRVYEGSDEGFRTYTLDVPDDQIWAKFYRSNSGRENVKVYIGEKLDVEYQSFEIVDFILKKQQYR